jgi:hypothetical protein
MDTEKVHVRRLKQPHGHRLTCTFLRLGGRVAGAIAHLWGTAAAMGLVR